MSQRRAMRAQASLKSTHGLVSGARQPHRRRLRFEPLEERRLLSITVNTLVDEADGSIVDGDISLRDAIVAAPVGETIDFSVTGTINLSSLGQLIINKSLTINGPGASLLTIRAFDPGAAVGNGTRIFIIDDGNFTADKTVALSGLTLTGGDEASGGGAIYNRENLTVSASMISGNSAGGGGGILNNFGTLSITKSTISGNSSGFSGGGLYNDYGSMTVTDSTISGNSATGDGGAILTSGNLLVTHSTLSGNSARYGGAIVSLTNLIGTETTTISNCTISGNSAATLGGGIFNWVGLTVIQHSTITHNTAPIGRGSGVASFGNTGTRTEVYSTIIAGNNSSDVDFVIDPTNSFQSNGYNLIGTGNATGEFVEPGDQSGVANLLLGALADNGGPTKTHALLVGSTAIDMGDPAIVFNPTEFDQRGNPFVRVFDGDEDATARIDIGSYERQSVASLIVDTLADENDGNYSLGDLSLREAIVLAHGFVGAETITFDAALGGGTITLKLGELRIRDSMTINGLGADLLTIDASGNDPTPATNNGDGSRIFHIDDGDNGTNLGISISGLTITGGDVTGSGGGISNAENLTLASSRVSGNAATFRGGGIYDRFPGSVSFMTLSGTIVSENSAAYGGGIFHAASLATVVGSTISGNHATASGGGIEIYGGDVTITDSTISGNSSNGSGGGIANDGSLTVVGSTISGNSAGGNGGGVRIFDGAATITGSTISGNKATQSGGGLASFGSPLTVNHSTITGNDAIDFGGGIYIQPLTVNIGEIMHCIVAGNTRGAAVRDDILGEVAVSFSLIGVNTGAAIFNNGGNLIGTAGSPINPLLGLLADNGGPTKTHALLVGSPAIDMGDPAAVFNPIEFDQRGDPFVRVFDSDGAGGARIDIGAYERQTVDASNFIVDTLIDENDGNYLLGDRSLREAIRVARGSVGPETITFAAALTSGGPASIVLTQGELRIADSLTIDGPGANRLTIDASGSDPTPTLNNSDGSRVLSIDNGSIGGKIDVEIVGLTLTGGDVNGVGGGIRTFAEDVSIVGVMIRDNSATAGGGIHNTGGIGEVVTVTSSTISGNSADNGGGIYNQGDNLTVTDTTISGNAAKTHGGGISSPFGAVRLAHSTITGNVADSDQNNSGLGGGIAVFNNPYYGSVNVTLDHTIVAGNIRGTSTRSDINGPIGGARFSLVGVSTGATIVNNGGNLIGTSALPIDPLLGALADNAGPTYTHALLAGSPAIDAGDPAALAGVLLVPLFDQRGEPFIRVFDGDSIPSDRIDIGAVERQPIPPAFFGDYNQNGVVDAADYVVWRKALGMSGVQAYSGADGDGDTTIDQDDYNVWRRHFGTIVPTPGAASASVVPKFSAPAIQIRESALLLSPESTSVPALTEITATRAAGFAVLDNPSRWQDPGSGSRGRIHRYGLAESGRDDLLLLAIDRVGRSSPQGVLVVDDCARDDVQADEWESQSLIDDSPAVALAEWRWVCADTSAVRH